MQLFIAAVSAHKMLKFDSAVISTKYCNHASHSVNSLQESSCWNLSVLLDFILLGLINKSKRSFTFDLRGILSQYKPPSRGVNSALVNSQSGRTSLAEVRVKTTAWFLGCFCFHSLCKKQNATEGSKNRWLQKKLTQNEDSWDSIWEAFWKLMVTGNCWLDCQIFPFLKLRYLVLMDLKVLMHS